MSASGGIKQRNEQSQSEDRCLEESDRSVVFKGDGEPKTPEDALHKLTEFQANLGMEPDTYTLGGTVEQLEKRVAEMLGKEQAIFMPTGTLANHLAIRKHCGVKSRAIVQEQSHLYNDTGDTVTRLSGINLVPLAEGRPHFGLDELVEALNRSETGRVESCVGAVMIESPVRRKSGQVLPFDQMKAITEYCVERGIPTHLDGARLFMMSADTGISPQRYSSLFDTVYVSLYKYFGAPFGAILAGRSEFVDGLFHDRRMFGGSLLSAYLAAALALQGIEEFEQRFAAALKQAKALFTLLDDLPGISIVPYEHGSNIFPAELSPDTDVELFVSALNDQWVFVYPDEAAPNRIPLFVNTTVLRRTNDELFKTFRDALKQANAQAG